MPLDEHRVILVYHRQHGGRCYVRWRVFHKHRKGGNWYPDKRGAFVIPIHAAHALAAGIAAARLGSECSKQRS